MEAVLAAALVEGRAADLVAAWRGSDFRPIIRRERVAPLLAWSLRRSGEFDRCPPDLRAYLDAGARAAAALELAQRRELESLTAALVAAGIAPVYFKGAALAYTCYDDPSLRPREDTDVLIVRADAAAADRVLSTDLGYSRAVEQSGALITQQAHYERQSHGCRQACDVHWKPFNPQLFAAVLGTEEIRASAVPLAGVPGALAPSLLHSLMIAVVHRIAHHDARQELLWLMDIALICRRFDDWDAFATLALSRGVATIAAAALERTTGLLGAPAPPGVVADLRAHGAGEPTARYLEANLLPSDVLLADLAVLSGWRARVEMIREHLFPPRTYIARKYRLQSSAAISLAYVWRIARGAPGWLHHDRQAGRHSRRS